MNVCIAELLQQARGGRQDVGRDTNLTAFRNVMFESLETRRNEGLFFRVSVPQGLPQLGLREYVLCEGRWCGAWMPIGLQGALSYNCLLLFCLSDPLLYTCQSNLSVWLAHMTPVIDCRSVAWCHSARIQPTMPTMTTCDLIAHAKV